MSEKEYELLERGNYIETTSFLSASENLEVAASFFHQK